MAITIDERNLSGRGNGFIRTILSPIYPRIAVDRKSQIDSVVIFGKDSSTLNHNELFKTNNENIKANYFEVWKKNNPKQWTLQKLHFRIEMKEGFNSYSEILNFHIDFAVVDDTNEYKKYPHIHIKHPKIECISNAHIPLNLNDISEISDSIEKFNDNVSKIIAAINDEFISAFKI